jgi:hypothetical protein
MLKLGIKGYRSKDVELHEHGEALRSICTKENSKILYRIRPFKEKFY